MVWVKMFYTTFEKLIYLIILGVEDFKNLLLWFM